MSCLTVSSICSCEKSIPTKRREVVKLVIAEVPRFPALAEFYYHAVIERALAVIRVPIERAIARGELPDDTLLKFLQLIVAPAIMSIVWNGLFERHDRSILRPSCMRISTCCWARRRAHEKCIPLFRAGALGILLLLTCCGEKEKTYQGWVEADLIFVSPDEAGRIEKLHVREGTAVDVGTPLFSLDQQLQRADVNLNAATLKMAQQTFDRAEQLRKTGSGTQRDYDAARGMRVGEARLNSSQTRLDRREMSSPVSGTVQQIYFRPGEMVTAGRPVVSILPPGNLKLRFFVPESILPRIAYGDRISVTMR